MPQSVTKRYGFGPEGLLRAIFDWSLNVPIDSVIREEGKEISLQEILNEVMQNILRNSSENPSRKSAFKHR